MIPISTKYRSEQAEIMDDFALQGDELQLLLTDLKTVNTLLGGTNISLDGVTQLLKYCTKNETITIIDIGCGDGEILRKCAGLGEKLGLQFELIGLDANVHILNTAREKSKGYSNIQYQTVNILSDNVAIPAHDIALCTLFLHHFPNDMIIRLLQRLMQESKAGVVINDLERNKLAFSLFKLFSFVFLRTKIAKHDGLVSIARSFRRNELQQFSEKISNTNSQIRWKWAFRYQWILRPTKNT
ncbi:MAG: 2-polyprenyl-3-methyl-5-hydroxy-6-metoxy-1,4-benzoquinol methylase [Candidatus Latescibacterota bacterium]|jgi:2-polyprenyl-3-methyl-5-hydroxy-6-metoxy-1,4-benzoquinol methylase